MIDAAEPVIYTVRFPSPVSHYAEIDAMVPSANQKSLEVFMPVWTPGSYLVREFARNVEGMAAFDDAGKTLAIEKTRKNRWVVSGVSGASVRLHYRVYCREMTVRTNWVDENFALLNGAASYISPVGDLHRRYEVKLELPAGWKLSISGLQEREANHFVAPDFDTLVDSPILAGSPTVHEFTVDGKKHFLVNQGESALWDGPRSARDTQKIVEQNLKMWGSLPYEKYVFLNLIVDSGGGLEHKNSVCIMAGRYSTRTRRGYLGWLDLVSHEYFHAWNVKRLRPVALGPFDYESENYTPDLWVAEGFTDYYAPLNVRRAGLSTDAEILFSGAPADRDRDSLSARIEMLQNTPGRLVQPLGSASFDSWIKLYRPDENTGNSAINYYLKGSLVGWLLDAHLRHLTDGKKSLDDGMRLAFARYSGAHGYTDDQFRAVMSEVAGQDLTSWFHKYVQDVEELDYTEALEWFGLEFKKPDVPKSDNRPKAWIGFITSASAGRLVINQIPRGTPAETAGLSVDDEILAVDNWRVNPDGWGQRLEQYAPGDIVDLLVSRRDQVIRVPVKLGEEPSKKWQLQLNPKATDEQKNHLTSWLR
jgi:predicted metalloprotease with PDZ domain